jgi:hypothetical protein
MFGLFLGGGFAAFAVLLIVLRVGVWIWQTYDAYKLARKYNAEVERTGKPPW